MNLLHLCEGESLSPFPANQLAAAERDNQGVDSRVRERMIEHGLQGCAMIDGVVGDENASRNHARQQLLITVGVDFLLGVEKAEGNLFQLRQTVQSVAVN